MKIYFIYKYEWEDGHIYVGQTYHGSGRYGCITQYRNTIGKYMRNHPIFNKEILCDNLKENEVDDFEIFYIKQCNSFHQYNKLGLNYTTGGAGIHNLPDESKKTISEKIKGKHNSPYTEFKKGLTPWNKGIPAPWADCSKAVESRIKDIKCSNGEIYHGSYEAARCLNLDPSAITKCCKGKLHQTHGYTFEYIDKEVV